MYVIKRIDKEYGSFTTTHKTIDEAREEANRLAIKHVQEGPEFTIYELKIIETIFSSVLIQRR